MEKKVQVQGYLKLSRVSAGYWSCRSLLPYFLSLCQFPLMKENVLTQWFSAGDNFIPKGTFSYVQRYFWSSQRGGWDGVCVCYRYLWVKARDACKYPTKHKIALPQSFLAQISIMPRLRTVRKASELTLTETQEALQGTPGCPLFFSTPHLWVDIHGLPGRHTEEASLQGLPPSQEAVISQDPACS
jgi:hypothetical protein